MNKDFTPLKSKTDKAIDIAVKACLNSFNELIETVKDEADPIHLKGLQELKRIFEEANKIEDSHKKEFYLNVILLNLVGCLKLLTDDVHDAKEKDHGKDKTSSSR